MALVDEMAAKLEIQELESRYEWAVDEGRVDSLANLFALDATFWFDRQDETVRGRDGILAWFRDYCENWGWRNRRHYVSNFHIKVNERTAAARFYYLFTYEADGAPRLGWGHYDDSFVKVDGRWWISGKRIHTVGVVHLHQGWAGLKQLHSSADHWE